MEGPSAPVPFRFNEEDSPLWLKSWWKVWIWSRPTFFQAAVRSPIFEIERRGLLVPIVATGKA